MAADPVAVDPRHYKVEFENDRVRVLRVTFGPHEKSVMHAHPAGISVSLTNRDMRFTLPDGRTRHLMGRAGDVVWYEAHEHLPENLSSRPYEGIHIEVKS
jgi:quercetin dioxygenase-like cupin family protein